VFCNNYNPHTTEDLQESIQNAVLSIHTAECQHVVNVFVRYDVCLHTAESNSLSFVQYDEYVILNKMHWSKTHGLWL